MPEGRVRVGPAQRQIHSLVIRRDRDREEGREVIFLILNLEEYGLPFVWYQVIAQITQ
jgi:hypothetical protein